MPQKNTDIGQLIMKYAWRQELSKKEISDLHAWQARSPYHQKVPDQFRDIKWVKEELRKISQFPKDKIWQRVKKQIDTELIPTPRVPLWKSIPVWKYATAAIVIGIVVASARTGWLYFHHATSVVPAEIVTTSGRPGDRTPENFQVLLTLGDSSTITLDHRSGTIPSQGNSAIARIDKNGLIYTINTKTVGMTAGKTTTDLIEPQFYTGPPATSVHNNSLYNSITTRQANPFHLTLPDGSKITLCYASYLRYPVEFNGQTREITLTGQAYFDIAADPEKRPFIVHTVNNTQIEVLGTQFNIMAYPEEPASAITVFDGSVKVLRGTDMAVLQHFDQALVSDNSLKTGSITPSGAAAITAWNAKDPYFSFRNTDLLTAIRELARWYRVEIYNPDGIKGRTISVTFHHSDSLKDILQTIQQVESGYAFLTLKKDTILISATKQNH
jgi:hypothetical protein